MTTTVADHHAIPVESGSASMGLPSRRRHRRAHEPVSIALTLAPMIDMSFTFLIFFVVTTRFIQDEGVLGSKMPRTAGSASAVPPVSLPVTPIVVRLRAVGPTDEDCTIALDAFPHETPAGFHQLADTLRAIQQKPGFDVETPIVIAAETVVRWDHVVNAWNAALRAECKNIAFAEP